MIDGSDTRHTRHARAVVRAVIASVLGDLMVYVSSGAERRRACRDRRAEVVRLLNLGQSETTKG
jgi:hypothetical protein